MQHFIMTPTRIHTPSITAKLDTHTKTTPIQESTKVYHSHLEYYIDVVATALQTHKPAVHLYHIHHHPSTAPKAH